MDSLEALNPEALVGVGLRRPHHSFILENKPPMGWFEIISENYFKKDGPSLSFLDKICVDYPLSFHGIGLSLGSAEGLDKGYLSSLKEFMNRFFPFLISDHLSWSNVQGGAFPTLLPIPYTDESFALFADHIAQAQDFLGREMLLEKSLQLFGI